jgi:alcohol dehydrogenase class IV
MAEQKIFQIDGDYSPIYSYIKSCGCRKIMLVCGKSAQNLKINNVFTELQREMEVVRFSGFTPNPLYDDVVKGVDLFNSEKCDMIVALGGGSAIDVAKCIKLFSNMRRDESFLAQQPVHNEVKLVAIPTTAGTGAEATQFAVIYHEGVKQSVSHEDCIPETVVFDPDSLKTLPEYQRKVTMLDALCHGIESFWSVKSTEESMEYADMAVRMIMENLDGYLGNTTVGNANMLKAANLSGKAINISQTTAGHAMCYKLTGMYGLAHGHAAALCVSEIFLYMIDNVRLCTDTRGADYLKGVFKRIAAALGCEDAHSAAARFRRILDDFALDVPEARDEDYAVLKKSVNPERLMNNPVRLDEDAIEQMYRNIFGKK